ncbi:hypothetical protein [Carboxylicivirga sp. N1Y90]|uniref:hypothetical protein n=1 Tax=Carboxylicivirga fragile TaxID=3417571 RepID=UPI003D33A10D|nr:hypothetical protein [Marinilabiliaceae bacterium N1Y90]
MKVYKVSVSDDKVKFFKQLLDNLNIDYSVEAIKKETKVNIKKSVSKPKVQAVKKELHSSYKQKNTQEGQKSIQEVLKNLEQLRG